VAPDQVGLEPDHVLRADAHVGQLPEPGVDPVHRLASRDRGFHGRAACRETGQRRCIDGDARARIARDGHEVGQGERTAVEHQASGHGRYRMEVWL
jgi:hypothetical protein